MRVAMLSFHSCPLRAPGVSDAGGMNISILNVSRELAKQGVEVDIFTRRHNLDDPPVLCLDNNLRLIHICAGNPGDIPKINMYDQVDEFAANLKAFILADGFRYDVIHSHYWLSALAAERLDLKIPTVITFHTLAAVKNQALKNHTEPDLRIKEERRIAAITDRIIAFTAEERENLVTYCGADKEKITIIPNGVNLDLFRPFDKQQAKSELGLLDYRYILLFAGRIQPIKGLDILLRAMTHLPNGRSVFLVIAGGIADDSLSLPLLQNLAEKMGISSKVSFLGPVAHEKMPVFYNAADICVMPSYHESFGLVAAEALATGTPVLASRVGGLATIVQDGETGYLVEDLSPEAFALHLCLMLTENKIRQSMAKAARPSMSAYNCMAQSQRLSEVYQEFIQNKC